MMPDPYYCQGQDGTQTLTFATPEAAIAAAVKAQMAPFTVYQLVPHPIGQRLTNTDGQALGRQLQEKNDGVET